MNKEKEMIVVVGNKAKTDIFLVNKYSKRLTLVEHIENSTARKKVRDFVSDIPGGAVRSMGLGIGQRKLVKENSALRHALDMYTISIAKKVQSIQYENKLQKVMLISEPGFQGELNKQFQLKKIDICKVIPKDLKDISRGELFTKLKSEIQQSYI